MNNEECNKIIAEFMDDKSCSHCKHLKHIQGVKWYHDTSDCDEVDFFDNDVCDKFEAKTYKRYVESLDALVPVWIKLNDMPRIDLSVFDGNFCAYFHLEKMFISKTIQEAAAMATAKAILELKESAE